ncbi:hypothetical protein [Natronoarchaeum sp. GCM10025703]|uniref:hypothetical protein n=1 Tax=Natronoarchaeum sp. GCM10025703 TaxID=3252685 RepID=UPI003670F4EE
MVGKDARPQVVDDTASEPLIVDPTVSAAPEQVLTGHPVGPSATGPQCADCGTAFVETDLVFAYAYRCADRAVWDVPRLYCWGCAPGTVRTPTLGATEVLVGGRLGTIACPTARSQRLCLTELALRAYSPPMEGVRYE